MVKYNAISIRCCGLIRASGTDEKTMISDVVMNLGLSVVIHPISMDKVEFQNDTFESSLLIGSHCADLIRWEFHPMRINLKF